MSLAGLFALGIQAESLQAPSPSSQGKGESLEGKAFLDELATLWEHYGDPNGQPEDGAALEAPESETKLGADFAQLAEALATPAANTSAQSETTEKLALGDAANTSKAEGKSELAGFQKAAGSQPTKPAPPASTGTLSGEAPEGSDSQKSALAAKAFKQGGDEVSPTQPKASQAGVKVTLPPLGRHVETLQQWEALARPFEPDGKLPPQIERILDSGQEGSGPDQSTLRNSLKTMLIVKDAQSGALRPAAGKALAKDALPSSPSFRPTSDATPKAASEASAEDGRDSDPSRHSQAAQRSGASAPSPTGHSQAAASGLRFADLLQAQPSAPQPGVSFAEAHAASARAATASGEGLQAEMATVRGQDADQVFSQVVQNARLLRSQGETRFEVRLKPEFLGRIRIESHLGADHKMTTRFLVEDPEVRILLESRLPLLAERLGESGVRMTSLEVHSMNSQTGGGLSRSAGEAAGQSRQQQDAGRQGAGSSRPDGEQEETQPRQPLRRSGRIHLVA